MKYLQFTIDKYRAVEHGEVAVGNSLIPIIGLNESGKTTILQAILAFDKNKDRYNKGLHLEHKNKYEIQDREGSISANILLESDIDLEFLAEKLELSAADPVYKTLESFYSNKKPITLVRTLPTRKYSITNPELQQGNKKAEEKLANAVYEGLPFILYFDDFSDRVPEYVQFNINKENSNGYEIPKVGNEEWHSILEEVFKRATDEGGFTLGDFLKLSPNDKTSLINDIQDILHKNVVEDWKNLKKQYGEDFGEETEALSLKLDWDISDNGDKITFKFKVEDRTTGKGRPFNVTERSKGFQWFFNFIMKLKFNPKYQANQKGAIYLLDEPGSYLHTSAQGELLKKLQDISNTNTILYCTHSQFLLDPDIINISKIKIARKETGKINVISFDSAGVSKNEGALTPLNQALHLKSGFFNKEIKYPIITEGVTDFYLFNLLKNYKKDFFPENIDFIPGGGADHLKDLISHAIAFSENYIVFLDSDEKGKKAYDKYREYFGDIEAEKFFKYTLPVKKDNVILEDYLSAADKKHIIDLTGVSDIKTALPALYYSDEKTKEKFIKDISDTSIKNLEIIKGKVTAMVSKSKSS